MYVTANCNLKNKFTASLIVSMLAISMMSVGVMFNIQTAKTVSTVSAVEKISDVLLNELANGEGNIRILVETASSSYESVKADITQLGGSVSYEYSYINALAASLPKSGVLALANNENIVKIYYDEMQYPSGAKVDGTGGKDTTGAKDARDLYYVVDKDIFDKRDLYNVQNGEKNPILEANSKYPMSEVQTITLTPEQMMLIDPTTYWNPVSMNARTAWAYGYYGQGSLAVIIDTGVYADHFMLSQMTGYPPTVIGGIDLSSDVGGPYEGCSSPENHWHGTHCAGILAGHGAILVHAGDPLYKAIAQYATPPQEASSLGYPGWHIIPLTGMAPLAQIYAVKVFDHTGGSAPTSTIIYGIEYAIDMKVHGGYDVDVISMSLGGGTVFDGRELEAMTVDYATSVGITVSASAGNDGPAAMTVGSPATANTAISAAAAANPVNTRVYWDYYYGKPGIGHQLFVSDTPQIYAFSSRGPTSDGRDKPEVSATGMVVLSAMPDPSDPQGLGWASGTSMACPAVSGTVALLAGFAEYNYGVDVASPEDFRQAIKGGAVWLPGYDKYDQGAGYLNAGNALFVLAADTSLGDVAPPLPPTGTLTNICNVPIVGSGVYTDSIADLNPGMNRDYIFEVTERTDSITLEITNVRKNIRDPYNMNSFEAYIGSATRTTYAYYIDSANVWGNAKFVVTDYETQIYGATTGAAWDDYTRLTAIEPGYIKITIENDWTSSARLSGNVKITVTESAPPTPNLTFSGTVADGGLVRVPAPGTYIYPPSGTTKVVVELWWQNDWSEFPTSDLDMWFYWYNGTVRYLDYSGATLNSPERVTIEGSGITKLYVYINGYAVYTGVPEPWTLKVYYYS